MRTITLVSLASFLVIAGGCDDDDDDDGDSPPTIPCGEGEPSIAFTFVPAYGTFQNLTGQVCHVWPDEHRVAVYIYVGGGWWTKPYWDSPLTNIYPDGSWVCDVTTGGIDSEATSIAAFLVPAAYDPPLADGGSLPAAIEEDAIAEATVERPAP
jgi:hypothetical protein